MKKIIHGEEPLEFQKWKSKNGETKWNEFTKNSSDIYKKLKDTLIHQQDFRCCYCEKKIKNDSSHIDHLQNKNDYPKLAYVFENLLASCQETDSCGHFKKKKYIREDLSPKGECSEIYSFTLDGRIIPIMEDHHEAENVLNNILNLNNRRLKNKRFNLIKEIEAFDVDFIKENISECNEYFGGYESFIQYVIRKNENQ